MNVSLIFLAMGSMRCIGRSDCTTWRRVLQSSRARRRNFALASVLLVSTLWFGKYYSSTRGTQAATGLPASGASSRACIGSLPAASSFTKQPVAAAGCNLTRRGILSGGGGLLLGLQSGNGRIVHAATTSVAVQDVLQTVVFAGEILKSPNDPRSYKAITLANGLRVLLISDPAANTAAAALDVHVGFNSDPEELAGLAHFCEHMLFLGNAEYPEENSFKSFVSSNGGSQNAFTSETETTYYFDLSPNALEAGLTRFSAFFKSPLFTASATEREVKAIESEDAKNRQSDGFRGNQLMKSFALAGHPQRHFGTGNRETLSVQPERAGINTREALLKHFQNYYDSGLMTLSILGRESTETLQTWVEKAFGKIVSRGTENPSLKWRGINPYPQVGGLVEVVPVADRRSMTITWPLVFKDDSQRSEWSRVQPQSYVGHLLGHEGKASLLSVLKKKGWINGITAGSASEDDNFALIRVSIGLTQEGLSHREDIIESVYAALERLKKGIPYYIFDECRAIAKIRWRFAEKVGAQRAVLNAVDVMQSGAGPADYVAGRSLLLDPKSDDPKLVASACPSCRSIPVVVSALLEQMTPSSASYMSVAKEYSARATKKEAIYGTPYNVMPWDTGKQARWNRPADVPEYKLPEVNPFIPIDFAIKSPAALLRDEALQEAPQLIRNDSRWQIFFKADRAFSVPKAYIKIILWLPESAQMPDELVPGRIWQAALADRLGETYYDAGLAGLEVGVGTAVSAISISFSGYSDRLPLFVADVLAKIRDFDGATEAEYERGLDVLRRELQSFPILQPYQHAGYFARLATASPEYSIEFLRSKVDQLTIGNVRRYGSKLRTKDQGFFGQALLHGNLNTDDAAKIESALMTLPFAPVPHEKIQRVRLAKLPQASDFYLIQPEPNFDNVNHALTCTYWIGSDPKDGMLNDLFHSIFKDPFYASLRTEQQLGYIVSSGVDRGSLVSRFSLVVQSSVKDPVGLLGAVDEFMGKFRSSLAGLSLQQLQQFKDALAEQIQRRDERLAREASRWWSEITTFQYLWKRRSIESALVKSLSKDDVLAFFDRYVDARAPERRRLVSTVFAAGPTRNASMANMRARVAQNGATIVDDFEAFQKQVDKWPLMDLALTSST